ncbi:MAG: hypothetical protein NTW29_19010 [Bacteroidetes bacterium]|nr:hypothetical protein [Bacteroidota bacterium]
MPRNHRSDHYLFIMHIYRKPHSLFIIPVLLLLWSCGSGDKKTENGKESTTISAPALTLKPTDLSAYGIPLTIQAPDGAIISKEEGSDAVVVRKDRFNVVVSEDKYVDEDATPEQAKETALAEDNKMLNDPDMGMKMEVLKNDPSGYVYMTTNRSGGKIVRFTCYVKKDAKKFVIKENFLDLNDTDKAMETGYGISREEAEQMYNALKQ